MRPPRHTNPVSARTPPSLLPPKISFPLINGDVVCRKTAVTDQISCCCHGSQPPSNQVRSPVAVIPVIDHRFLDSRHALIFLFPSGCPNLSHCCPSCCSYSEAAKYFPIFLFIVPSFPGKQPARFTAGIFAYRDRLLSHSSFFMPFSIFVSTLDNAANCSRVSASPRTEGESPRVSMA